MKILQLIDDYCLNNVDNGICLMIILKNFIIFNLFAFIHLLDGFFVLILLELIRNKY